MKRLLIFLILSVIPLLAQSSSSGGVRVTGSPAANDCAKFVSHNVITTAGAACGSGGGGSVLLAPTADQTITGAHALNVGSNTVLPSAPLSFLVENDAVTATASGTGQTVGFVTTLTPASNSAHQHFGLNSFLQTNPASAVTYSNENLAIFAEADHAGTGDVSGNVTALGAEAFNDVAGTISGALRGVTVVTHQLGSGLVAEASAGLFQVSLDSGSTGDITNGYGLYVNQLGLGGATGIVHNYQGLHIESPAASAQNLNPFGIFINGAAPNNLGSGTSTLGNVIDSGLSASLPVQTNGSKQLTSAAINLSGSQVTGQLPISGVGSSGLSGTSPITISAAGAIACATCNTTSSTAGGALTGTYPNPTIANLATGGNPGPVPYVSSAGTLSEDASNFCWDATNHRLGIGTCAPAASTDLDVQFSSGALHKISINNNTNSVGAYLQVSGGGVTQFKFQARPTGGCSSLGTCGIVSTGTSAPIILATNDTNQVFLQTTGELDIGTATAIGGTIKLDVSGGIQGSTYNTNSNCSNAASPAACGAAPAGVVAVPTGTNPTLTINTTAVTANSNIFLQIDESSTIAATTCNSTLSTLVQPVVTARTAATSFTIQIGAVIAANPVCVSYHIIN